jgi:hypothetical protein
MRYASASRPGLPAAGRSAARLTIAAILLPSLFSAPAARSAVEELAPGVTFTRYELPDPNVVHVVAIARDHPEYRLMVGWPEGKRNFAQREGTSVIAGRYHAPPQREVVAAVNASFFGPAPRINGVTGSDGELQEQPDGVRDTLLLTSAMTPQMVEDVEFLGGTLHAGDGEAMTIHQFNRTATADTLTAYTRSWGAVAAPEGAVAVMVERVSYPLRAGKEVAGVVMAVLEGEAARSVDMPADGLILVAGPAVADAVRSRLAVGGRMTLRLEATPSAMNNADFAITGVGWVLRDGKAFKRNWRQYGFSDVRHPRTAIAWNDTHIFLMVVDGRSKASIGMTFEDMAKFMRQKLKATDAVNLDGGGSSTMFVGDTIRNVPSDGRERPVANAVLLVREAARTPFPFADDFPPTGRADGWDDKFSHNAVAPFTPAAPGGDGFAMTVMDPAGGVETVRRGARGDADYALEAAIFCEHRPADASDGFERYGLFARDDGTGGFGLQTYGGGNCYALTYDSHDGRIRAGVITGGVLRDFLEESPVLEPSTAWRRFRIECEGASIRYFVDDRLICERQDATHASGFFGLAYQDFFTSNALMRGTRAEHFKATAR